MRKSLLLSAFALLVATARPARAAADEIVRAHIPFAFHVVDATFPPGDYIIESTEGQDSGLLMIRGLPHGAQGFFLVENGRAVPERSQASLVFDRYGTERFLHAIRLNGQAEEDLRLSSAETRAALALAHAAAETHVAHPETPMDTGN